MTTPRYLTRAAALLSLATAAASAQPAPTAPATPAPAVTGPAPVAANDQVVQLSEFQVAEKSTTNNYIASETMSGSRVNTKIIDLPYSIVNLTSEFFRDFGVQILDENMTYIGGLTDLNIGGSFNLRGFSATSQLKDGFYRLGRYGLSNIDRIEVIRGPNAAIYGRSSPGGMVNFVSLQPSKDVQQQFTLSEGNYKQGLGNLNLTGTLEPSGKTYYVLDVNQTYQQFVGQYDQIRNNEDYLAIEHDFSDSSHLKITGEYFLQIQHAPQGPAPIVSQTRAATPDNAATTTVLGYDTALASFNPYGPNSELNRGSGTVTLTYDKEFNDVWSTRFGAYRFGARRWDFNQNTGWGGITLPLPGATTAVTDTRGSLPSRGEIMEDGGGFQEDVSAHYWLFGHTVENNSLLTVDLNDYYRWDPTWEYAANTDPTLVAWSAATSGRVVTLAPGSYHGRIDYIPTAPLNYFPNLYNPNNLVLFAPGGNSIIGGAALNGGTLTRRRTTSLGGNLRQQMKFMDGRLIFYAGLRTDNVLFSQRDYTVAFASVGFGSAVNPAAGVGGANQPGGSVVRRYEHQNKPNTGFNYQVIPNLYLYGSYSTAYFVDQTSRPSVIASSTYAPFTAKGYDFGVKGSYFDQRLNFTVGGYYDKEFNVLVTDTVEIGPGLFTDLPEQDGDQLVRGWETDLSWAVTPQFTVGESLSGVNAKYTYYGSAYPEAIGRNVQNITPENGSAYANYHFDSGALRGLYLTALVTYVEKKPSQTPIAGDTTAIVNGASVVTAHTDAYKLTLPSFTLWNFGVHYQLPRGLLGPKWDERIDVIMNNAFNLYYLKTNANRGYGRTVFFQYTIKHSGYHP